MNIGEKLREARLQKNISLDELQQMTKIQKRYLKAIEDNDFDSMPGTFYVRAFIRQYAQAVGLDGNELVNIFDGKNEPETIESAIQFETLDESRTQMYDEENQVHYLIKNLPAIVFSLIGLAIAIVVLYITWQNRQDNPIIQTPASRIEQASFSRTESSSESVSSSSESVSTSSSTAPKPQADVMYVNESNGLVNMTAANVSSPVKLLFTAPTNPCWVGVYVATAANTDNGYFYQETIQPGQPKSVELPAGTTQAVITFGASENMDFKLNEQKVEFNPYNTGIGRREIHMTISYAAEQGQSSQSQEGQAPIR